MHPYYYYYYYYNYYLLLSRLTNCSKLCKWLSAGRCKSKCLSVQNGCIYLCIQRRRPEWVLMWPGQIVVAGCQTYWTTEVSEALAKRDLDSYYKKQLLQVFIHHLFGSQLPALD